MARFDCKSWQWRVKQRFASQQPGFGIAKLISVGSLLLGQACGGIVDLGAGGAGGLGSTARDPNVGGALPSIGTSEAPSIAGNVARGATLFVAQTCGECHGANAAGLNGPNITLSRTAGIGSWTYQEFHDAVRHATDRDGSRLCLLMPSFPEREVTEQGMRDLYAYLRSMPSVDRVNTGTFCN